ncbi:MAG: hypothetical protein HC897_07475 [Thermoanaerobaculia bacterium]|nr:hypothetical protein [Thermoanaerobaculia bacterium]
MVAYSLSGTETGRWGEMPASGFIQESLTGGGIAACPDGMIYYSYINSPEIFRLDPPAGEISPLRDSSAPFYKISEDAIMSACEESDRLGDVGPLVKLGLQGSRIMALYCSNENILFRQIAQPHSGGSHVEAWDLGSRQLVATLPSNDGVLFATSPGLLHFVISPSATRGVEIEHVSYSF